MAGELSQQARIAREKLKTNLMLLNNASVRTAGKVRRRSPQKKYSDSGLPFVHGAKKWTWIYVLCSASLFVLLISFIVVIDPYGIISLLSSFITIR
jgi:hypothetical protein